MNFQAASWFIQHLDDGKLNLAHAPDPVQAWFETLQLPMDLLRFLQWRWPQTECQIGPVSIHSSERIQTTESVQALLPHKLLPVGYGPNGDTFAIDFSVESCPVGFITHEEYDGESDPRPFFQPSARSIESFLYRVAEGRYVPCDYYATQALNTFLQDEASHDPFPPYQRRPA